MNGFRAPKDNHPNERSLGLVKRVVCKTSKPLELNNPKQDDMPFVR